MSDGKVRALPWDTPGVPPSTDWNEDDGYSEDRCGAEISVSAREAQALGIFGDTAPLGFGGFYCTRPPHDSDEPHVCHYRFPAPNPNKVIVWGGE